MVKKTVSDVDVFAELARNEKEKRTAEWNKHGTKIKMVPNKRRKSRAKSYRNRR